MLNATQSRFKLPDGYTVTEKLGSGGYGEVWRAQAPGGVEKAIKLVFGHCDEQLAERELKSLDRIRSVRHPFVLSLERYEVVEGRLVIVTELADMSLDECFRRHREDGRSGIPRDELLGYLSDAAEALDCLTQRHSLLHLDIKPENLLVVGEHVKVADFGLVKEVAGRTLNSMMGGMTPIYAAPEIFDDNPTPHSDQYSLAIVYQEMLTGVLPFPGRTPAQLAMQHIQASPNLKPLGMTDRSVIGRALAKNPDERFPCCCSLIAALRAGDAVTPEVGASPQATTGQTIPIPGKTDEETRSAAELSTLPLKNPLQKVTSRLPADSRSADSQQRSGAETELAFPEINCQIVDVEAPQLELAPVNGFVPTIFVALGGLGGEMLRAAHNRCRARSEGTTTASEVAWLAIDTDRHALAELTNSAEDAGLSPEDTLHIPLRRPKQYRDACHDLLRWVSRRWLYNIPRSLQTRGYRPLGRIAAVDRADEILESLRQRLHSILDTESYVAANNKELRAVLLAGMGGGTGGGAIIDLAQAIRSLCGGLDIAVSIQGVLGVTYCRGRGSDSLGAANTFSLLTELAHTQGTGNCGPTELPGAASQLESTEPPFDHVYCIEVSPRSQHIERGATLESIADYLMLEATGDLAHVLESCRRNDGAADQKAEGPFPLRTFGCVALPPFPEPQLNSGSAPATEVAEAALKMADATVLDCGYRRQTLAISPAKTAATMAWQAYARRRPTLAIVPTEVTQPYLLCEGNSLSAVDLAARLAEDFSDVDRAAGRLHSRNDISWYDLRAYTAS